MVIGSSTILNVDVLDGQVASECFSPCSVRVFSL